MPHYLYASLFAVALASSAVAQSTWYVDVSAAGPGDGSAAAPYTSVQYAIERPTTLSGDTLLVAPGEYLEAVTTSLPSGFKSLTIRSLGGAQVTSLRSDAVFGVLLLNSQLEGFTVAGAGGMGATGVGLCGSTLLRCVVTDKFTGIYACGDCWVLQSTITANFGPFDISVFDTLRVRDSIVWGNTNDNFAVNGELEASYSLFGVNITGVGNLTADPLFWDGANSDWSLKPASVCVDAADPAAPLDPDGSRRDMGAFAFEASYAPPPVAYCTAKVNSLGCTPAISAAGTASATSPSAFVISCHNQINQRFGVMSYGFNPLATPYQGGWKCVMSPTRRTPPQFSNGSLAGSDCTGAFAFDFNAWIQLGVDPALQPGELVYAQYWSRDPGASFANNRSDAVRFGVAP